MTTLEERPAAAPAPLPANPPDPRAALRKWLYVGGLLPLVVALAFGLKVVVMGHHDRAGQHAWAQSDAAEALEQFAANRGLNILQPWIAHFDAGDAAFRMQDWPHAVTYYRAALARVPKRDECTVRINLSLTYEAVGDAAAKEGETASARKSWTAALGVLQEGHCPTRSGRGQAQTGQAETLRKRLQQKLDQKQQPKSSQQQDQQKQSPDDSDKKQDQLDKRNGQGQKYKNQYQDLEDYGDFSDQPQW